MNEPAPCPECELIVRCGATDDPAAWGEFVVRFNQRIALYVIRERRARGGPGATDTEVVQDLIQEVYVRLLANDRRALREFRGDTAYAALAYLARIARAVVADHARREGAKKRSVALVSLGETSDDDEMPLESRLEADERTRPDRMLDDRMAPEQLCALMKKALTGPNAARDAAVFQLHAIEALGAREIAAIPGLRMSLTAVESVIRRTRERLRTVLGGGPDLPI